MNENPTINKAYTTLEKKEVDAESRTIVAWGSRPVQDRDKEIIDSSAWDLKNFQKNPVLMLSHNYSLPPIGRVVWIKATKEGLRFKAEFAKTQMGEEIWSLYRDGFMQSFSVGFLARKYEEPDDYSKDAPRRIYKDVELLEISCVSIPSCPDALLEAYNSGAIKTKEFRGFIEDQLKLITVVPNEKEVDHVIKEEAEAEEQEEKGATDRSDREEQKEVEYDIDLVTESDTPEEKFCECEEPDFEDDECRGCGGRRKPRKPKKEFVEEIEDVGFGEVMGEEPNPVKLDSIELEVTVNKEHFDNLILIIDALNQKVLSLEEKLLNIQKETEEKVVEEEIEQKAGRILSKRTLGIIQRAIDALNELITLAEKPKEDEEDDEEDEEDEKSFSINDLTVEKEEKPEFNEKEIGSVVKEVLNDIFSKYSIDTKELLDEALKRKQGRMF